jgi:hypothetical protein
MESSLSNLKKVLRHREEFSQANNEALQQLNVKFIYFKDPMVETNQQMEEKFIVIQRTLITLSCRMEAMEVSLQHLRAHPQHSVSVVINHG